MTGSGATTPGTRRSAYERPAFADDPDRPGARLGQALFEEMERLDPSGCDPDPYPTWAGLTDRERSFYAYSASAVVRAAWHILGLAGAQPTDDGAVARPPEA